MKNKLERLLELNREMNEMSSQIANEWSESEEYRNDAKRQQLCLELMECLPRPHILGTVVDRIARRINVDLQ